MVRSRHGWWALALLAAISAFVPAAEPAKEAKQLGAPLKLVTGVVKAKISPVAAASLAAARKPSPVGDDATVAAVSEEAEVGGVNQYAVVNLEFATPTACANFKQDDVHIFARNDRFADVFALNTDATISKLSQTEGLVWMELTNTVMVPPPARPVPRSETSRDIPDKTVRGGMGGLTGKGVVIAVIDSGIDFHHPDFITYDAQGRPTSRLLYFWDVASELSVNGIGEPAPIKFPSGTPIGTVYSRDVLTADLRSAKPQISVWDPNGHGTSCAGVAAGNGNSNKDYIGVAPEADLIVIRGDHNGDTQLDSVYLVNAFCAWLDKMAGDRPLVVSCSWGGQYGGRDGQSIQERHLSSLFPLDRRSRAICFAAGNDGDNLIHAPVRVGTQNNPGEVSWEAAGRAVISLYVQTDDLDDLTIGGVDNTTISENGVSAFVNPLTKQAVLEIAVEGSGALYLYSKSGRDVGADAYLSGRARFSEDSYELAKQIGCPSTADNVLAVGSYDWNDRFSYRGSIKLLTDVVHDKPIQVGTISAYSNPGPRRYGGQVKPELVAPGQWHTAPAPLNVSTMRDSTGQYHIFNGTSAATPYTAGVIALLLQANPQLAWGELREMLTSGVTQDAKTGKCPNARWGYGKLDYAAVERLVAAAKKSAKP